MFKTAATTFVLLLAGCSTKLDNGVREGEDAVGTTVTGDVIVDNAVEDEPDSGRADDESSEGDSAEEMGPEVCDGVDNDGDGDIDEGLLIAFYWDEDGDGWGSTNDVGCALPDGASLVPGDCDDTDASIHPEAIEVCNGVDENCNDEVDEGVTESFFGDADGDGFGAAEDMVTGCTAPEGYVDNDQDCNDAAAVISPDSIEFCNYVDDNCDGEIDEDLKILAYPDADSDGYGLLLAPEMLCTVSEGYSTRPGDCNDEDASVNPDGVESCNDVDDDCNGLVDDAAETGTISFWSDLDGDGHGNGLAMSGCSVPTGYAATNDDCDDLDASRSPSAEEICNGIDDNCNEEVDDGVLVAFYEDNDGDGYGTTGGLACTLPDGFALADGDCDDTDASINPGIPELCNGFDENCNGIIDDEPADGTRWYPDDDDDGFGDPLLGEVHCVAPSGFVANDEDCDPLLETVSPTAEERCNEVDDNCDGSIDNDAVDALTWFRDIDGDGFGNATDSIEACVAPEGFVDNGDDCNDTDETISPLAEEVCDAIDNDCNGLTDDSALDAIEVFPDEDEDGYGASDAEGTLLCEGDITIRWSYDTDDCNDDNPSINPEGVELCNGLDDDCDGERDEESEDRVTVYEDTDRDGFGVPGVTLLTCEVPEGWSLVDTDCDASNANVYPGADEYCNERDDDCDGVTDEEAIDRRLVYPDSDGDGYGRNEGGVRVCSISAGWVESGGDCDDGDGGINPGARETCDGYDENCDDVVDNGATDCACVQRNLGAHSYMFCDARVEWWDARDWCDDRNYTLATINSLEEHQWILGEIRDDPAITNREHWIGLNDLGSEGDWKWVNGESYSYRGWSWSQPDNARWWEWPMYGEDCVETNRWRGRDAPNEWNDNPCDRDTRFICEAGP